MKKIILKILMPLSGLMALSQIAFTAPDPNFHIYLLFGQSNMEGQGDIAAEDRETHPRVRVLQGETCAGVGEYGEWRLASPPLIRCVGKIGPGDTFGKSMAENTPENITIGLVGAAYQGQSIDFFLKNCAERGSCSPSGANGPVPEGHNGGYAWLLDLAKKAQEVGVIKGILMHQGETDTGQQTWPGRVNMVVSDLRNDLGLGDVPFIAGEMVPGVCCTSHNPIIQQIPQVISNAHVVSADGLGNQDPYHFNATGYRELGRRYAEKMLPLVDVSAEPRDCGTADGSPVCCDISADPDGDGWGLENDRMCLVTDDTNGYIPPNSADIVAAINVGSAQGAVFEDVYYEADRDFEGGQTNATTDPITGSSDGSVFQTERYGDFTYEIPVSNGAYTVQLNLVEMYWENDGEREINIAIEGTEAFSYVDIHSLVGHDVAYIPEPVAAVVNDSSLTVSVSGAVESGTLSGLVVRTSCRSLDLI